MHDLNKIALVIWTLVPRDTIGRTCWKSPLNDKPFKCFCTSHYILQWPVKSFNFLPLGNCNLIPYYQRCPSKQLWHTTLLCKATHSITTYLYWNLKLGMCGVPIKHNRNSYNRRSSSNNNKIYRAHLSNQDLAEIRFTSAARTIFKEHLSFVVHNDRVFFKTRNLRYLAINLR